MGNRFVVVGFMLLITMFGVGRPATTGAARPPIWQISASPNRGTDVNDLNGVTSIAPTDAWAVGSYRNTHLVYQTLIEHWNGTTWSGVASPNVGSSSNILAAVVAASPTDVWAVGRVFQTHNKTLIEHWDGTGWRVMPSPNIGTGDNELTSVVAIAANNVWAVGSFRNGVGDLQALIEHYSGGQWKIVQRPNPGPNSRLLGVAAVSATDVWAVGRFGGADQTLTMHWNGSAWQIVPSPNGPGDSLLASVAVVTTNDVWAVGSAGSSTLIEQWNGRSWRRVASPNPLPQGNNFLTGVAVKAAGDLWAVGSSLDFSQGGREQTLTMHWNGTRWTTAVSPNAGSGSNVLLGISPVTDGTLWAVGDAQLSIGSADRTLILRGTP